jgi:hypothetical protein
MEGHGLELLLASLVALAVGPVLYGLAGRRRGTTVAFQAIVVTAIVGLIAVHLLPECVKAAGWPALVAAGAGLLVPVLLERRLRSAHEPGRGAVLGLALVALALHEMTDGMLLVEGHAHAHGHGAGGHQALGLAVVLHRAGLASVLGFALGERLVAALHGPGLALFQAFGGGILLHVLLHAHGAPAVTAEARAPQGDA